MAWKTTEGGLREYLRHFDTEDLVCYHSFFDTCPRCESLNTHEAQVSHPYTGVEVVRKCENCGKEWMTKVFSSEFLDEYDGDDEEEEPEDEYCPTCGALWGWEEREWGRCYACGYPDDETVMYWGEDEEEGG